MNRGDVLTRTNTLTDWTRGGQPNIMLNSDMVLAFNASTSNGFGVVNQACGPYSNGNAFNGCATPADQTQPNTVAIVQRYLNSNANFLTAFGASFKKMLSVGYGSGSSQKLGGPLVDIDLTTC